MWGEQMSLLRSQVGAVAKLAEAQQCPDPSCKWDLYMFAFLSMAQAAHRQEVNSYSWRGGEGRWHQEQQPLSSLLENVYLNGQIY